MSKAQPQLTPQIVRGLRHITHLVGAEMSIGEDSLLSENQGGPGIEDAEPALAWLQELIRWWYESEWPRLEELRKARLARSPAAARWFELPGDRSASDLGRASSRGFRRFIVLGPASSPDRLRPTVAWGEVEGLEIHLRYGVLSTDDLEALRRFWELPTEGGV